MRSAFVLPILVLAACSTPGGPYPSLQPRAAEAVDPRVEVVRPVNDRPLAPALASRLAALVEQARAGDAEFLPAIANAEALAASAGAAESESWIAAQEALSAAIAGRRATALAVAEIDALSANALQTQGGIAPNDLAAIESAARQASSIANRQADRIDAVQRRLSPS